MRGGRAHDETQNSGVIRAYVEALLANAYSLAARIEMANPDLNLAAVKVGNVEGHNAFRLAARRQR
jgi:hypothetical protein